MSLSNNLTRPKIEFINTLRGIAIISVLIDHYFVVFWFARQAVSDLSNMAILPIDRYPVPTYSIFLSFISPITLGAYGVALFFLVSGFLIPFSIQKYSVLSFCTQRFFRIVPTYLVGFTISLLSIWIAGLYSSRPWTFSLGEVLIHYIPGIRDLLWSRSIDGIVSTLEIEVKFYFICACFSKVFKNNSLEIFLVPFIMFIVSIVLCLHIDDLASFAPLLYKQAMTFINLTISIPFMFIGVIFNFCYRDKINVDKALLLMMGMEMISLTTLAIGPYKDVLTMGWSYMLALLTFSFAYSFPSLFRFNKLINFYAEISYPLYVVHGVGGYVLLHILLDQGISDGLALPIVILVATVSSWVLHVTVEIPSQRLNKYLSQPK
jgi:peptidoglycan/LPS O-acetylase OafA/YrhL